MDKIPVMNAYKEFQQLTTAIVFTSCKTVAWKQVESLSHL